MSTFKKHADICHDVDIIKAENDKLPFPKK